jgi:hypothetical protein
MNTYKHTPGPWLVSLEGFARKGWAACPTVYACDSDLRYIAFCNDDMTVGEPTDNEANARLIAAAPCLLDALQRLNSATRRYMEERPESDAEWASDETSVLSIVDAAIAKATGEAA